MPATLDPRLTGWMQALAVDSAQPAEPEPRLLAERLIASETIRSQGLRLMAIEETRGCAGATLDTDALLERGECRRLVRALVAAGGSQAVLAASIVEMPSRERALVAIQGLGLGAWPRPLERARRGAPGPVDRGLPADVSQAGRHVLIVAALRIGGARAPKASVRDAAAVLRAAVAEEVEPG